MKTDSSRLIEIALALFRTKGYKRTSMTDIAQEAGLLKGSIYHHFPDKEHLLISGVQYIADIFEKEVFGPARDSEHSEKERFEAMFDAVLAYYLKHRNCAFIQLWPDVVNESGRAREIVENFYRTWQDLIAKLLTPRHGKAEAKRLAADSIAKVYGGVIWLQIMDDSGPLKRAVLELRTLA
ncbi:MULTISPECIES: TetR/AcrR family transcriptional regulator [unclassified Variovorax]|uniref:TetR/AcrR family transcriptional regulator n=1 Tax=unclassified Variovorax TaxID=663243 RepID=UPI0032E64EE4